jgi:hypothetical protein
MDAKKKKKTSIYLDEADTQRLNAIAEREGLSHARVIREAIRRYEVTSKGHREFAMAGSGHGPGGSVADIPEDELLEGFGE